MKVSSGTENNTVCNSQDDVCLPSLTGSNTYNLKWWKHIDGLHGYGAQYETDPTNHKSHYDLASDGKVSAINSKPGEGVNNVHGHTIGCWTKCDANYVNNKLKTVALMGQSCSTQASDGIYVEDSLKDALEKCESLFLTDLSQGKIDQIKNMSSESEKKLEMEKILSNRNQCAVFQFPENPGYEFSLDENKDPVMPSDYTIPQDINEKHKFKMRYGDGSGFNKLKLAKMKPDIFKSLCPGKWIVVTENAGKGLKIDDMNKTSGSNIKNEDPTETPPPTPYHKTYNETYEIETFQDEISKLVKDDNLSEAEFDTQLTAIIKAYFIYLCVSGYEDDKSTPSHSEDINNDKIIDFLKNNTPIVFKQTSDNNGNNIIVNPTTFVKDEGIPIDTTPDNIYNAFVNKIDTDNLNNLYAKGGEHVIDLRAGPNSANTINGKQVSLVYNNRCALTSLVNGVTLDEKVTDDTSDKTKGSKTFNDLIDIPSTPPASVTADRDTLDVSVSLHEKDITLKNERSLDADVSHFTRDTRVVGGKVVNSSSSPTVNQSLWYHPNNHSQRDAYHFPHYANIPTAFAGSGTKYDKTPVTNNDTDLSRCNQIKYRHGIISRKGTAYTKPTTFNASNMGSDKYNKNNGPTLFGTYNWSGTQLSHNYDNNAWSNWNIHYFTTKRLEPNDYRGQTYDGPYNEILGCATGTQMSAPLNKDTDKKLSEFWGETLAERKERHRRICSHMKLFQDSYKTDTSPSNDQNATSDYNASIGPDGINCDPDATDEDGQPRNLDLLNYGDITQCQQIIDTYGVINNYTGLIPPYYNRKNGWAIFTPNWGSFGDVNPNASNEMKGYHEWHKMRRVGDVDKYYYGRDLYGTRGDKTSYGETAANLWDNLCDNAEDTNTRTYFNAPDQRKKWFEGDYNTKTGYNEAVPRKGHKLPGETQEQMNNREFNICANINYSAGLKRVGHPNVAGCNCSNMNTCADTEPCKKVWDALECGNNNRFQSNSGKAASNTAYNVTKLSGDGCEHGTYYNEGSKYYLGPSLRDHPIHNKLQNNVYRTYPDTTSRDEPPSGASVVMTANPYGEPFSNPNCTAASTSR